MAKYPLPTFTKKEFLATISSIYDDYEGEMVDWFTDCVSDSLDVDWTPGDAARAIIRSLDAYRT